jgi:hypothetical protein
MKFDVLIQAIEQTHQHFQHQASKAVNVSLTLRNWLIGFYIVEFELHGEDRAVYGQKLFEEMALRLKNIRGIDRRSLYRFKDFYQLYPQIAQYITDKNIALNLAKIPLSQLWGCRPHNWETICFRYKKLTIKRIPSACRKDFDESFVQSY